MQLPQFQSGNQIFQLMQSQWASILNPAINVPLLQGTQLSGIDLVTGNNVINTKLGRKYQGWIITSMTGAFAQVYEVASNNPAINLTLNSSGPTTVSIWVF